MGKTMIDLMLMTKISLTLVFILILVMMLNDVSKFKNLARNLTEWFIRFTVFSCVATLIAWIWVKL